MIPSKSCFLFWQGVQFISQTCWNLLVFTVGKLRCCKGFTTNLPMVSWPPQIDKSTRVWRGHETKSPGEDLAFACRRWASDVPLKEETCQWDETNMWSNKNHCSFFCWHLNLSYTLPFFYSCAIHTGLLFRYLDSSEPTHYLYIWPLYILYICVSNWELVLWKDGVPPYIYYKLDGDCWTSYNTEI